MVRIMNTWKWCEERAGRKKTFGLCTSHSIKTFELLWPVIITHLSSIWLRSFNMKVRFIPLILKDFREQGGALRLDELDFYLSCDLLFNTVKARKILNEFPVSFSGLSYNILTNGASSLVKQIYHT